MSDEPKTLAEQLDAATNGQQFATALLGFMAAMDRQRYGNEDDTDE